MQKSRVYKQKSNICNEAYVDQTGCNFKCRLTKHEKSWRLGYNVSSFSSYLKNLLVSDFNSMLILRFSISMINIGN